MALAQTDMGTITVPDDVLVVGLGEASHGVKEYQEMKAEVFQALVQNKGCRTFVIETDFGSALKVDAYIHGGEGTAGEAAGGRYYIDFSAVSEDHDWSGILSEKQRITALNVTGITISRAFYTMEIVPEDTFDGMIIFDKVSPTTLNF